MTLRCCCADLSDARRGTVCGEADEHRALKVKGAAGEGSVCELVNEDARAALAADAVGLEAAECR